MTDSYHVVKAGSSKSHTDRPKFPVPVDRSVQDEQLINSVFDEESGEPNEVIGLVPKLLFAFAIFTSLLILL